MFNNFAKQTLKRLKHIDIFAQPVQLLIKQESGHKTLCGAGLTLLLITLFGYFLIMNLYTLSLRRDPSSFTTQVYHASPEYYFYDQSNFTLTFSFESPSFQTYIDESIYVVDAVLVKKSTKLLNGTKVEDWSQKELPLTPCSTELIRQNELQDFFSNFDLKTNYCINWDEIDKLELQGAFSQEDYSYIFIQFKMCNNQTKKQKECKSKDEIVASLEKNYFSLQLSSLVVNVKDSQKPFVQIGQDAFTTISSKIFKEIAFYLEPVTMFSDFGLITKQYIEEKSLRYKGKTEAIDINESDLIMNVAIRLDNTEQQYYRSYPKIQSIFGELGGLWQIFATIAFFIQKPISILSYYVQILNSLFQFDQLNTQIDCKQEDEEASEVKPVQLSLRKPQSSSRKTLIKGTQQIRAQEKLHSIQMKAAKLDNLEKLGIQTEYNQETKIHLSNAISTSIKKYFHYIAKKLKMKWTDYLYFIKCFQKSKNYKSLQIDYSLKKVRKQMDILYILKKLQEIDKLKMILLSESQIKVFDYLQKPSIPIDPESQLCQQFQQYFSILKPIKSNYQRAIDAQAAFHELTGNIDNPINIKLINSIDQSIVELLKLKKKGKATYSDICISEQAEGKNQILSIDIKRNHN